MSSYAAPSFTATALSGAVNGADSIDVNSYVRGTPKTSDDATTAIEFKGMEPYASATGSNRVPGNAWLTTMSPSNGGTTYGKAGLKVGSTEFVWATQDSSGVRSLDFASGGKIYDNIHYHKLYFYAPGVIRFDGTSTEFSDGAGGLALAVSSGQVLLYNSFILNFHGSVEQTTVGAAGGASALPATPSGYLKVAVEDITYVVPYYAAS